MTVWNLFSYRPQHNEDTRTIVDVEAVTPKKKEVERRGFNGVEGFKLSDINYTDERTSIV